MQKSEIKSQKSEGALVCFAVREEAAAFKKILGNSPDTSSVKILVTGIGERNARRTFQQVLESYTPEFVLTCGFAGGLNPTLKLGSVIFSDDSEPPLSDSLVQLGARVGGFYCANRIAVTAAEKDSLWRSHAADAVEMESSIIRAVCKEKGIPSATIRVILDAAEEDLPLDFNALMTSRDNLDYLKLTRILLTRPQKILPLWQLHAKTRVARRKLDDVVAGLLRTLT